MRPIHLARLDTVRPVLILTREIVRPHLRSVSVVPITSAIRGLSTEVRVGQANGLDHDSVISCDSITTIPVGLVLHQVGYLLLGQEAALHQAIAAAYDLE
jgi:mRNA interferase MazF